MLTKRNKVNFLMQNINVPDVVELHFAPGCMTNSESMEPYRGLKSLTG